MPLQIRVSSVKSGITKSETEFVTEPTPAEVPAFVHLGDAHLRRGAWMSRPGLVGDAFYAFSQAIDYAIAHNLPVVSSGDLFNSTRPAPEEILFFNSEMRRLADAGLRFFKIDGNHELTSPSWASVGLSETVIDFDQKLVTIAPGVTLYGLASRAMPELHEQLAAIPTSANVLVCHQLMDWSLKYSRSCNMEHNKVPLHVRLTLASDLHFAIEHRRDDTGQLFAYNGSMCMQKVDEPVEKSFMVVNTNLGYRRVPLKGRPIFRGRAMTQDEFETILLQVTAAVAPGQYTHLPLELQKPMVVLELSSSIDRVVKRLEDTVGELGFLFLDPINTDLLAPQADTEPVSVAVTDVLGSLLDPKEHPDAFSLAMDLITGQDPVTVITAFRDRHLGTATPISSPLAPPPAVPLAPPQ